VHWQSDALTTRLDLIRTRLDLIRTRIDIIRTLVVGRLALKPNYASPPFATPRLILNTFSRSSAILTTREDKTAVPLCETDSYEILYKVRNEMY
jgi:hypothetical protein